MNKIRVLIIDDHSAVCQALAVRLGAVASIKIVGATCDFVEGLRAVKLQQPDIILLEPKASGDSDRQQSQVDSVAVISSVLARACSNVIILTSYLDETERDIAIETGAKRYLLKDIDTARLIAEIEEIAYEDFRESTWPSTTEN